MGRTAHIVWTSIGIGIMAALLITAVVWGYKMRPTDAPCKSISYIIEDKAERLYVTEAELQQILREENIEPVGKQLDMISLNRIEKAILRHPMVRTAECYLTPRNEVKVRLTQRVPLLRVQTAGETYIIDTDRKVMQARAVVRDSVLICIGTIGVQIASRQLADFAEWLQKAPYWQHQIHHLYVHSPQLIYLYLKEKNGQMKEERIVMGTMRNYDRKLKKLRTFMDFRAETEPDKKYAELDLRFKGQVIGRY